MRTKPAIRKRDYKTRISGKPVMIYESNKGFSMINDSLVSSVTKEEIDRWLVPNGEWVLQPA
jgi:hypothetical protein